MSATPASSDSVRAAATNAAGGMSPNGSAVGKPAAQIAQVVPDLDTAMRIWWDSMGVGPWHVYTLSAPPMTAPTYRGKPAPFSIRIALAFSGNMMFEMIQPLGGESIWHETLQRAGGSASFQHVAIYVEDYDGAIAEMRRRGWRAVQTAEGFGRSGDGMLTYFEHDLGPNVMVEIVRGPSERFMPERTYPVAKR